MNPPPPILPSILPVTHSLSLPRSQPLITVIGGFGEMRQRDRKKKGGERERFRRRGRLLEVRGPALSTLFHFSHHLSHSAVLFPDQGAGICFGISLKMKRLFAASKPARSSNRYQVTEGSVPPALFTSLRLHLISSSV